MHIIFANTYIRTLPATCYCTVTSNYCDNNVSIQWIAKAIRDNHGIEYSPNSEKAAGLSEFLASKCSLGIAHLNNSDPQAIPSRYASSPFRLCFRTSTVEHQLKQLDPSEATGPRGVPALVLKHCTAPLDPSRPHLFTFCFELGVQPSLRKAK